MCVTQALDDCGFRPGSGAILGKHLHLFRRGNVFYWRRRVPGLSTSIEVLQLSLRTEARTEAYIISHKLTAESDRMFDALTRNLVSMEDARKWLSHVITEELARIRRVALVSKMDRIGPAGQDRRMDWATAQSLKLLAEFGPHVRLGPEVEDRLRSEGASDADISALETCLDMHAADMRSDARMNRIASEFGALTGRDERPSAFELAQLRQLLIEGRVAAHAQREAAVGVEAGIAQSLAEKIICDFTAAGHEAPSADAGIAPLVSAAIHERQPVTHAALAASQPASPVAVAAAPALAIPAAAEDAENYDPSILATVGRLNEARLVQRRREAGTDQVPEHMENSRLATANLFIGITGLADVRHIRQTHVSRFRDAMHKLPKSWGKSRKEKAMPMAALLKKAESLPPDEVGLSVSTINRHLDVLRQILGRAEEDGIDLDPKVQPKKLRLRETVRSRDKRPGFAGDDLGKLFAHSIWTGCRGRRARHAAGDRVIKDALYWVPLIAAYTGARREEISGLVPGDIREEDGVPYFDMIENENRCVKTLAGERRIPVHDRLIELGFLDHVAAMRRRKSRDVFPELRPKGFSKGSGRKFGAGIYDPFAKALEHVFDGNARGFVQHSFRHYVNDRLARVTTIPKVVRIELMGHEGDDTNERVYIEPSPIRELQIAINALPVIDGLPVGKR